MDLHTSLDPERDLVLTRTLDAPPAHVWRAWTDAAHLAAWFVPAPWSVAHVEIDARPGGAFRTVMRSPDGDEVDAGDGCVLEAVPDRRLVWTSALGPGFRPLPPDPEGLPFTAVVTMDPRGSGTAYRVVARHADADGKARHEAMGFLTGWGAALDQMIAHVAGF